MITAAIVAWLISGFAGWAWMKWDDWLSFPALRKDITICTLAGGVAVSVFGLILLLVASITADHWPFRVKCPIVLIKGNKP